MPTEATPEDIQEQLAPVLDPDLDAGIPDLSLEADVADQAEQAVVVPSGEDEAPR